MERETAEHVRSCHDEGNPMNYRIILEFQQHKNKGIDTDF